MPSDDPIAIFSSLFERASRDCAEPDAMVLSTVDPDGRPSARYVLLKGVDDRGFVFYTNVESRKAKALAAHPHAALTFYWPPATQVRIEGPVERVSDAEADAYFATRPRGIADRRLGLAAERRTGIARGAGRPRPRGRGPLRGRRGLAAAVLDRLPRRGAIHRVLDPRSGAAARARGLSARFRGMDPLAPLSLTPIPDP